MKKQILFVDDELSVLDALKRMLLSNSDNWDIACANRAEVAWELLLKNHFDVVVSDIKMPGMSGLDLLKRISNTDETKNIPVVMLSGLSMNKLKRRALNLGAADLLNKPVEPEDLIARLNSVLRLKSYEDELKIQNELLEKKVQRRTEDLFHANLNIIWRLAKAAEYRDDITGNHVIRVGCTSRVISEALGKERNFVETLFLAAPLHDIGKIGIPDAILMKRAPLSPGEREAMKRHCHIGAQILREDCMAKMAFWEWRSQDSEFNQETQKNPILEMGASIALTHHEKWNGTGYPLGLSGEEIPLESCIVAIADVFDAMTTKRPYKKAYTENQALEIIRDEVGVHFAPDVYSAFMEALPEIRSVRDRFSDNPNVLPKMEKTCNETNTVCG